MTMKRKILAVVAGFVLLVAGRYLIHSVWLAGVYAANATLWRTQTDMLHHLWAIHLANLTLATAAVLIYVRGVKTRPWLGQGIRYGFLLALATAIPQSMVEYFTYPVTSTIAVQWIIGEGALAVLLGVVVAAICRPKPAA
jgi:hypothetical protein